MSKQNVNRRTFVKSAGALGAAGALAHAPLVRAVAANEKLNHACIGVGGMGWGDLHNFLSHGKVNVKAVCDVDLNHLGRAAEKVPTAGKYQDWRELLDKEGDKIDSVNVTVPDHMHALIASNAIRMKKHVYCQKPMCHDIAEVRTLTNLARENKVVTQLGTQHASGIGDRMCVHFLKKKAVGKIKRIILCSNRPGAIQHYRLVGPRPTDTQKAPAHLDWDKWIGTAPYRDYAPGIYHPTLWRAWQDFGTGWSGDIGCHIFSAPWLAIGLTTPTSVVARVQESWKKDEARRKDTWPQSDHIIWKFPGNEYTDGDEVTVEWFDGLFYPPKEIMEAAETDNYPPESAMLVGTEGSILLAHGNAPRLLPKEKYKGVSRPKLPGRNHYHHFADACLGGPMTESNFLVTGPMTEAVLLGTVAIRNPGKKLEWDAKTMTFPNAPEANKLVKRQYRPGWEVEMKA